MHDGARSHLRSVSIEHTEAKCGTVICQKTILYNSAAVTLTAGAAAVSSNALMLPLLTESLSFKLCHEVQTVALTSSLVFIILLQPSGTAT
eukprot:14729-Heterococcus_DN1.PRE.2